MLCGITIENVAVIEKANAVFDSGFNVLTGETGAGKSILIDSINAILGNRTSKDIVRNGEKKAGIWATFNDVPKHIEHMLEEAGYTLEDELLIQRVITADGKSTCRINNAPATASFLREVCSGLINIHGQNDNQSLLNPAKHLHILDLFAQNELLLEKYGSAYKEYSSTKSYLDNLDMDESEKLRKIEILQYEIEEIENAGLRTEEYAELSEKRDIMRNSQGILEAVNDAYTALSGTEDVEGAAFLMGSAAKQLEIAGEYSKQLAEYAQSLNDMYYNSREIAAELQSSLSDYEFDPRELEEIEARMDLIYRLEQKYGKDTEGILAYCEKAKNELENIEFSDKKKIELEAKTKELMKKAKQLAQELTQSRLKAFDRFNEQILKSLEFLNMPGIRLELKHSIASLGRYGQDEIEYYISTNAGEQPKPMAKIASGGELSRIMLAFKGVLAERDDIATVIYDEIDTGISGLASGRIGRMLQATAKGGRQVICVTHTAQVAAYAQNHLLIEKNIENGRTYTDIRILNKEERANELARIVSGDSASEATVASARELLEKAQETA